MKNRNESLDALRGFAILTMILSGTIAFGDVLPAWMYHAQVPPPLHKFNPSLPGITWVDLVFPFFLFSMGAAIPLALKKHIDAKSSFFIILWLALKRFLLLAFFALFTQHLKAWVIADSPAAKEHLLSLFAFILLFFQFYENKTGRHKIFFWVTKIIAFIIAAFLLWQLPFWNGKGFDFYKSDIIIMVLANMAFFGTIIYYLTAGKPLLRIGILPFILAIFLAAKEPEGGWAKTIFQFSHIGELKFDWLYKFYFLKYLFIIIPGTFAGEWMLQKIKEVKFETNKNEENCRAANFLAIIGIGLVCINLYGLFTRTLFVNLVVTVLLCGLAYYITRKKINNKLYRQLTDAGTYLLLLGLFFEAYEGGIKKDSSTYSYYFVTSGLAFYTIVCFSVMGGQKYFSSITSYFSLNGKNPMVAYVAGNLVLLPLLSLTGTKHFWDSMNQNGWMGFLKGILFTGVVSLITLFFVKRKWFWKT